jgi:hypothetical protein
MADLVRAVLMQGQAFRFRAGGRSMTPFIRDGDTLTVTPIGNRMPRFGEVVAYASPGEQKLVVHRNAGRVREGYLMLGDALGGNADGVMGVESLLGRVSRVERDGKPVRLGLGPERILIAVFSRLGLMSKLLRARAILMRGFSG